MCICDTWAIYTWYMSHIIGKQQILICSKVVVKSNCTVYSVQWLNTWVTHTHNTHTQADTLTHWDSLFDTPQTSLYLNIWFKIQPLEKANIIDLQYLKKIFGRLYTALCIWWTTYLLSYYLSSSGNKVNPLRLHQIEIGNIQCL